MYFDRIFVSGFWGNFLSKLMRFFLIFPIKLQWLQQMSFGKKNCAEAFGPKGAQNGS